MKCRKQLVLTGYRVQFVDLREPKPRTPREQIHVADRQWLDALALTGQTATSSIQDQYERAGYKVLAVEPIKPKRVVEIDLYQLWELPAIPTATAEVSTAAAKNVEDAAE